MNASAKVDLGFANGTYKISNFYQNLRYGVYMRNSSYVNVSGSDFDNIGSNNLPGFLPNTRSAIFIDNDLTSESSHYIQYNEFKNSYLGIRKVKRTTSLIVFRNQFINIELNALHSTFANTVYVGGIAYPDRTNVRGNFVSNCGYGFTFMSGNDAEILVGADTIINPTIFPHSHAVYVSSISDAQGEGLVEIEGNYIEGYPTGVSALNQKQLKIDRNYILDVYANANFLTEGIKISNCMNADVTCNFIKGSTAQYSLAGIRSSTSIQQWVTDNWIERTGRAIHSNGISSTSKFLANKFSACQIGFYLNQSVIGPQWINYMNSSGFKEFWPQDNQWISGFSDHIYLFNSNGSLSPFRYRLNSPIPYHYPNPFIITLDVGSTSLPFIATSSNAPIGFGICDSLALPILPDDPEEHLQTQEQIMQMLDTMQYGIYTPDEAAQHWIYEQALFTELAYDTIDFSSNAYLVDFFDLASEEEIGQIENLEQLIEEVYNDSTIYASGISSSLWTGWNNATYPVMNYELFYDIYINALDTRDSTLTLEPSDINIIDSLAHLCPLVHGKAVYFARGLLDAIEHPWTDSECEYGINTTGRKTEVHSDNNYELKVYPNPAKEHFTLELGSQFELPCSLEIFNSLGVILFKQNIELHKTDVNVENLGSGIYFIRIKMDEYEQIERIFIF